MGKVPEPNLPERLKQFGTGFYKSKEFLGFWRKEYRLKQLKKALDDPKTNAGDRLNYIKYLDSEVGDAPTVQVDQTGTVPNVVNHIYLELANRYEIVDAQVETITRSPDQLVNDQDKG